MREHPVAILYVCVSLVMALSFMDLMLEPMREIAQEDEWNVWEAAGATVVLFAGLFLFWPIVLVALLYEKKE